MKEIIRSIIMHHLSESESVTIVKTEKEMQKEKKIEDELPIMSSPIEAQV